ncbi:MAG: fibronectin type III domain-containing protein [Dyadobacter sp.]|uniref:fibronectin type III domain-containing protein n=1 Tax=Dyadobacter sp. TaxID=1914288 RepID=UPI001B26453E|nr:fibronectin type III domain-containing protein [Dyadobacter sp.]MBO9614463.1 fibronectin type III domain-containing protein [Dyadobacter sp.]
MKRWLSILLALAPTVLFQSCNLFAPVDPLPPVLSKLEVVDIKRTEITVSGTINNPDSKNDRQEKKSGVIKEYGLVYGTTSALDVQKDKVIKLGETPGQTPVLIQAQKITGLMSDTRYYVALYARNEGGGMAYGETLDIKTTLIPPAVVTRNSVKVARTKALWYDFDTGTALLAADDPKKDITIDFFSISARGTVLEINTANKLQFVNLDLADYDKLTYLDLVRIANYGSMSITYVFSEQTDNTVIAFKTGEGRFGKWRIEDVTANDITMSLITYEN